MDDKKHPTQSQTKPESQPDVKPQSGNMRPTAIKRALSKRWLYPALYLGAAALIIGLIVAKSQTPTAPAVSTGVMDTQSPTVHAAEAFAWPVVLGTKYQISMNFFPEKGTVAEQQAALVKYDNTYYPHQGIDIKANQGGSFGVTAALSGKVTSIVADPLRGATVTIESDRGYLERYASLATVAVKQGSLVRQGAAIGTAGSCELEKSQGNHLYFEVSQNSALVNPTTLLPKQ